MGTGGLKYLNYSKKQKNKDGLYALLFVLPALLPLLVFWVWPILRSFEISFTDWDYMSPTYNYVGIDNYLSLLKNAQFYKVLKNTFVFTIGSTLPSIILGLLLALLLNRNIKGLGIYRAVLFSPWITPMVAVSIVWSWVFEPRVGLGNFVLSSLGLGKIEWTHSTSTAMLSVLLVTNWKSIGWTMVFYMDALNKIPQSLKEAAVLDGITFWPNLTKIILPLVSPTTFFLFMTSVISALQAYDQIQVLTQGGPAGATRTLLYYYYQEAYQAFNVGRATAVAMILLVITALLSLIQTSASRKWVYYQ